MNWRQLYTASTPEERFELMLHMLSVIETRQRRPILVRGRLIRERRRVQVAHWLNDRRTRPKLSRSTLAVLAFILVTLSLATWLIALNIHPVYGASLVFGYNIILLVILLVKPYRRFAHSWSL